ncbi:MAG: glycosyltransferase family 2 protein [candidate division WOR-3 bacterium]
MISVVIVNYNPVYVLRNCLENLRIVLSESDAEVIIVNNITTFSLGHLVTEYQQFLKLLLVENQTNLGYARAVNQGIKNARGEYILIINPDIQIISGAIGKMISFFEQEKNIGILAPQMLNYDHTIQNSCLRFPKIWTPFIRRTCLKNLSFGKKELIRYLMLDFDHQMTREVDWVLGAAMMTKKSLIEKIGFMDERFFLYFEDVDWCRRFQNHGFRVIYFPGAKFFHQYPRWSAKTKGVALLFNKFFWFHLISAIKYFKKWYKINA